LALTAFPFDPVAGNHQRESVTVRALTRQPASRPRGKKATRRGSLKRSAVNETKRTAQKNGAADVKPAAPFLRRYDENNTP
jgi:cytochrome oxidase assembly protein ShyY1